MVAFGGGMAAVLVVGGAAYWGLSGAGGPRSVPVIEPDPRPFKVRPDDPGGLRVPNQDELIFERNRGSNLQPPDARLAPEPEAPSLEALRAQVAQPPPRPAAPMVPAQAPVAAPQAAAPQAAAPQAAAPAPAAAEPAAPASFAPVANGRIRVQLGALTSDESARGEWDRLARAHADLLGGFRPQVVRFERDGQATLYRLRTGGFADVATAQAFCEQAKAKRMPCIVIR
jgi:cell division septation protein DedD